MGNRLIAIGDIHGEFFKFNNLLKKLDVQPNDTLVFLGDYIDRGLDSKKVVEKVIELRNYCHCETLLGNHEYFMLKMLEGDEYADFFFHEYGGLRTIESYKSKKNILKIHGDFFKSLKYYYKTEDFLFVHAGINPKQTLENQYFENFFRIRDDFIYAKHNLKQKIIFGHTPFEKPFIDTDKIGIDTGCGKFSNAPLTAYICNTNQFIQAK